MIDKTRAQVLREQIELIGRSDPIVHAWLHVHHSSGPGHAVGWGDAVMEMVVALSARSTAQHEQLVSLTSQLPSTGQAIIEMERERCAKLCEDRAELQDQHSPLDGTIAMAYRSAAKLIRATTTEQSSAVASRAFLPQVAPWLDFAGNHIHQGDTIRHPDGKTATVIVLDEPRRGEVWFADYGDGLGPLMLRLQIGDKGRAVVVQSSADGRWRG